MARPREFDEEAALDAAMRHFWHAGYAGSSVRDLADAMGLGVASLYNAFDDKRTLFVRCLDRYLDGNMRARIARLEAESPPRAAIEVFLGEIVERSLHDRLGCMLVNSALELAPDDTGIADIIAERLGELEGFFRRCVLAGQLDGSINRARDSEDLARLMTTTVLGLRVLARGRPVRDLLEGSARQATVLLQPSTKEHLHDREPV